MFWQIILITFIESYLQASTRTESSQEIWIVFENLNKIWDRKDSVGNNTAIGGRSEETGFEIEVGDVIVQGSAW